MKLNNEFDCGPNTTTRNDAPAGEIVQDLNVDAKSSYLLYFPDYRATNPYQQELYTHFSDTWRVRPGSLDEAARAAAVGESVIFHLHWPEVFFEGCDTADCFTHRAYAILEWLRHLRRHGGRSLWTAHNAKPHDCLNVERQIWFHRELAATVDAIHVHSAEALESLEQLYGVRRDKIFVVPHGASPVQPVEGATKVLARVGLGLQPDSTVFAFLGQLRGYKGIERLVAAFQLLRHRRRDIEILIGGKPVPATMEGRWARVGQTLSGAVVCEDYMSDDKLNACLAAADVMVLPYEAVLTSGSAHLAVGHGLPLIVPDLPGLREFIHAGAALTFDGMDVNSLAEAMERFADLSREGRATLSNNAVRLAEERTWPIVAAELAERISCIVRQEDPLESECSGADIPSLQLLYKRAHALARESAATADLGEPWTALLPQFVRSLGESASIIVQRALRAGWMDGCNGHEIDANLDFAERIDVAGGLPPEADLHGNIELVEGDRITGWAVSALDALPGNEAAWEGAGSVWVCENDIPIAEVSTRLGRADVQAIGLAFVSGFDEAIVRTSSKPLRGRIDLRSGRSGRRICKSFQTPLQEGRSSNEPSSLNATPALRVHIDGVADGVLRGWAQDVDQPHRTVFIDVEIDGVLHRDVSAATFRQDLASAGVGNGRHAFELVLPASLCLLPDLRVRILENGRNTVLVDTSVAILDAQTYRTTFSPDEYLRWAYINGAIPVGMFAKSHAVRAWFDINLRLLSGSRPTEEPRVDIIMPVYNRRGIVGIAIEFVLTQSYSNWRLIIIDDASEDGTADELRTLVKELDDHRITLITLDMHIGVSGARNAGLAQADADLICYLDSDNCWHRDFLRVMSAVMLDKPDVSACYCGQEVWQKPAGSSKTELRMVRGSPFNRSYLEHHNNIDLNAFMHRRFLYEELGGFHCDLNRLVDWELILRYTQARPAFFVPALLSRYNLDAAANRISRVEPLECALDLIANERPSVFEALSRPVEAPASAQAPLDILLVAETRADTDYWFALNLAWIDPHQDRLWYVSAKEDYSKRERIHIPGAPADLDTRCDEDDVRDTLLVSADWGARADWREVVAGLAGMDTAMGRLLERDGAGTGVSRYADRAPEKIADQILEWIVDAKYHATSCAALPSNFLWVSRRRALRLHASLNAMPTIEEALQQFYVSDMITPGQAVNLYLPDLVAYRIQGKAAIG